VLVATVRALKFHGGVAVPELTQENLPALAAGLANLERHLHNVREHYGLPCVVAINHFASDTAAEIELLRARVEPLGVPVVVARHWAEGGAGAEDLARAVVATLATEPARCRFIYDDADGLWDKVRKIATTIYGAAGIAADAKVRARIAELEAGGFGHLPVCIAKTQYSFSSDPALRGAPAGHVLDIREVRLAAGAQFVVMVCGDVMTMPGLPKAPSAMKIDVTPDGRIVGLF
jgi:formate--tetrahydrofolate ligase